MADKHKKKIEKYKNKIEKYKNKIKKIKYTENFTETTVGETELTAEAIIGIITAVLFGVGFLVVYYSIGRVRASPSPSASDSASAMAPDSASPSAMAPDSASDPRPLSAGDYWGPMTIENG